MNEQSRSPSLLVVLLFCFLIAGSMIVLRPNPADLDISITGPSWGQQVENAGAATAQIPTFDRLKAVSNVTPALSGLGNGFNLSGSLGRADAQTAFSYTFSCGRSNGSASPRFELTINFMGKSSSQEDWGKPGESCLDMVRDPGRLLDFITEAVKRLDLEIGPTIEVAGILHRVMWAVLLGQ